jgi:hypothetical protein
VLLGGEAAGLRNLLDEPSLSLSYKDGRETVEVHGLGFHERGGLNWPEGSDPLAFKLASGTYVDGEPVVARRGGTEVGVEVVRVGRVVARPWRMGS